MPDASISSFVESVKRIALEAFEAADPTRVEYGTVMSVQPLSIRIDQKRTYDAEFLTVPNHLKDIEVEAEILLPTTDASHTHEITPKAEPGTDPPEDAQAYEASEETHAHEVAGKVTFTLSFGLKTGNRVALLRKQGGGDYFVLGVIP